MRSLSGAPTARPPRCQPRGCEHRDDVPDRSVPQRAALFEHFGPGRSRTARARTDLPQQAKNTFFAVVPEEDLSRSGPYLEPQPAVVIT
ncbi:hypothetical protein AVEN_33004-1 [Araneus ventricosus]|uniref:Uncharacterized protein n=1 Tax=Araneus ventricosus TaxID=182803 RepID=A0A4Y2N056_ARAVE|nr:hypothetical protein AVEN_33004-1 [Araneus ventricosus]